MYLFLYLFYILLLSLTHTTMHLSRSSHKRFVSSFYFIINFSFFFFVSSVNDLSSLKKVKFKPSAANA